MSRIRNAVALAAILVCCGLSVAQIVERSELAPRSRSETGATLFEELLPDRTGVAFENRFDDPRRWQELWRQYFNGSIGTGVTLGDVNGDGLPDIFAVGKDSPNALYLNLGDFRFADVTERARVAGGEGFGAGATFLDIDNDGDLDLYVTYVAGSNELFINDGSGVFQERAADWGLDLNEGSNAPSFADYDRDGDLDLYLQQNFLQGSDRFDGMPDYLFENRDGEFVDVTEQAGIAGEGQGHVAVWWDFNEDGWPDVYVANDFGPADKLYRNNHDGTFTDVVGAVFESMPYSAMGADFGDLNNDGHAEFLVSEMAARDRAYYHQAIGPLSGKLVGAKRSGVNQFMQNALSTSVGPNRFVDFGRYAGLHATDWTWAARFADLDNDGLLDSFFANGMARAFHDGDIALRMSQARSLMARVRILERSPPLLERNLAFRNVGDLRFEDVSAVWGLDKLGVSFAAAFADFDRDGDLDLVVSNWKENLTIYRNNGEDGNRLSLRLAGEESNSYGIGAKVTIWAGGDEQSRYLSLTRGYMSVDEPLVHFGLGASTKVDRLRIEWPSGARQEIAGIEANQFLVIREESGATDESLPEPWFRRSRIQVSEESMSEEELYSVYLGQFLLPFAEDRLGPELAVADFDGDGWVDVALGGASGQPMRVFQNEGGNSLTYRRIPDLKADDFSEDAAIAPFDFDGDGDLDLFVASGGVELDPGDEAFQDRLYLNRGDFRFERVGLRFPAVSSDDAVLSESADGERTLFVAGGPIPRRYPGVESGSVWSFSGTDVRRVESEFATRFAGAGKTSDLALADLDGDGDTDLVQAIQFGYPRFWYNENGLYVERDVLLERERMLGSWRSICAADFNGDGRLDVAIGNLGTNNKYDLSYERPAALFASSDAELRGKFIEAETVDGKLYPRESRIFHQVDFPDIAARTGTYEAFSRMTVEEAFSPERMARYERYDLNERRSALLLQGPDGRFRAKALPPLAQLGVAIDCLSADFDRDGDVDLALVLETLPVQPVAAAKREQSFILLLINDETGEFETVPPWRSGLILEVGEARNLAWADLDGDGWEELVVSASQGPLHVFEAIPRQGE